MDSSDKSPATSTPEKSTTCAMYTKAEDVPPGPPFPTDDTMSEETVATSSSNKAEPLADDNRLICMLFMKATDVPDRPPFPTEANTQEMTVTSPADVTPEARDSKDPVHVRISFHVPSCWPPGSRLRVRFDGATPGLLARVQRHIRRWSDYANITFEFPDSGPSEIRVTFLTNDGNWSVLGIQALQRTQDMGTMNLNLTDDFPEYEVQRVVLHEFGHALGAIHEHQSPLAQIQWNRRVVYAYYQTLGVNPAWVDHNIFSDPVDPREVDADFDPTSIMMYPFPASHTLDGFAVAWVGDLSNGDMARIASMYPRDQYAITSFRTHQSIETPMEWETFTFNIQPQQPAPPQFAAALWFIDMSNHDDNLRVATTVTDVQRDSYTVGVGSWGNRHFYNGGVSLLRIPAGDPIFRMGTVTNARANSYSVVFHPAFREDDTPNVFAAFSAIDSGGNWRGVLAVHNVTHEGCDIQVGAWGSSDIYTGTTVQWIAYPSGQPGVEMGAFSGAAGDTGTVSLQSRFYSTPSVFMGIREFDISHHANARLQVRATAPNTTQVDWGIETWADSAVYSIVGVFLAISSGGSR